MGLGLGVRVGVRARARVRVRIRARARARVRVAITLAVTPAAGVMVGIEAARLHRNQAGSAFGQLALSFQHALDLGSDCPELRPASANQPRGQRWPATQALLSTCRASKSL